MLLYPPIKELLSQVPSRYMLVNVVARRARQIAQEAEDAGAKMDAKPVTLAIKRRRCPGPSGRWPPVPLRPR